LFTQAGGISANYIAKWNGSSWSALGSGLNNWVYSIAISGSDVYFGGDFTQAGGISANYIAKWDGSSWSALGSGVDNSVVAIAISGIDVYIVGYFTQAGGVSSSRIAKWNGSSWSALGSGLNNHVRTIAISGSDVYVGGGFTQAGGISANYIAKWNGSSWSALGSGVNYNVAAIGISGSDVYVGGLFTQAGGISANYIAKWNGSSWSALGSGVNAVVYEIAISGSDVYVGGNLIQAGGISANYIAKWDGSSWSALGSGVNDGVYAIAVSGSDIYVGGYFTQAGGISANHIAKWDGSSWSTLGSSSNPNISLSTSSLTFNAVQNSSIPSYQTFTVNNTGDGTLNSSVSSNQSWLTVNPTSNVGNGGTVTASINTTNLTPGAYNATITVTDANATNSPQTISVTYNVAQQPIISLNKSSLSYNAVQNGSLPSGQTFNISNTGGSTLNWTVSDDASWLDLSQSSGSGSATITASINTTALSPNTYYATITITDTNASNNPQTISVSYLVIQQPSINLNKSSLNFEATQNSTLPANQTFQISNGGGGTINWTVSDDAGWLDFNPASGTNTETITVSINTTNLTPGIYNATITIAATGASNTPQTISVSYTVIQQPAISLSTALLTFNATKNSTLPSSQIIDVSNGGGGTLTWTATESITWLDISPAGGTNSGSITASVNTTNLTEGQYNGTITVTATGASNTPQTINVTYNVSSQPTISLSTNNLTFNGVKGDANPAGQTFNITNSGGSLNWTVSDNASWLDKTPSGGNGNGTVTASINTTNMNPGTYTGTITVSAPGAANPTQTINVTYNLAQQPAISLNKTSLSFAATPNGSLPSSQTFTISNSGGGTLNWSVSDNGSWLDVNPPGGTNTGTITASINTTSLAIGIYYATITITAAGSANTPQSINVTYTVSQQPAINLSVSSLTFNASQNGELPASQTINISNNGGGTLNWSISDNADWLDVTPTGGTGTGSITASINTTNLSSGSYNATITVSAIGASNSPQNISVTYVVDQPSVPRIELSTNLISFEAFQKAALPASKPFLINNSGKGTLNWRISYNASWLDINPTSGTNTALITASIKTTDLTPGNYSTNLTITATGAINTPQTLNVTYTVSSNKLPAPLVNNPYVSSNTIIHGARITTAAPTITWNAVQSASKYYLLICKYPFEGDTNKVLEDSLIPGNSISYNIPNGKLQKGKWYRFVMATYNNYGDRGDGSTNPYYFNILLDQPTRISPISGSRISTLTPDFKWKNISGATHYRLYIADDLTNQEIFDTHDDNIIKITDTSYTIASGILQYIKTYKWDVAVYNDADEPCDFSAEKWTFTTISSKITLSSDRLVFDTTEVGKSKDSYFTIKNDGNDTLKVNDMFIDGTYASEFAMSGYTLPIILLPAIDIKINVKFTPNASGQRYARAVIRSNDPQTPETSVILRGTGKGSTTIPNTITKTSGDNQSGKINTQLQYPFVVTITDSVSKPVQGVTVIFDISTYPTGATGQKLSQTTVLTGSDGKASVILTLGDKAGTYTVTAISPGTTGGPIIFTATATVTVLTPTKIDLTSGNNQTAKINTLLPLPFIVTITDDNGTPVSNVSVLFNIKDQPADASGQMLSTASTITDDKGQAKTILTLGNKVGKYTVEASSSGLNGSPITFTAIAIPGDAKTIVKVSGDNQSGKAKTQLNPFIVSITDIGENPVPNVSVTFEIKSTPSGSSGDSLTIKDAKTDTNGQASTILKLGNKSGIYTVTATSTGLIGNPVIFTANVTPLEASTITKTSGDNQSGKINQSLSKPFIITIIDANNIPVSGVNVSFDISTYPFGSTGQTLSTYNTKTDDDGQASTVLTFGNKAGTYTVTATSQGLTGSPIVFTATASSGDPKLIASISGNNQSGNINTSLTQPFIVKVTDQNGNPVQWVSVIFDISEYPQGATGQSLSNTSTITDSSGLASTVLTLGNKVGTYKVTASSTGLQGSPVVFTANAKAGAASNFKRTSGNNQTGKINTILEDPLVVSITDAENNPVSGVSVTFTISNKPNGSTGEDLSVKNANTNSSGQAETYLTIGNKVGTYIITAASTGLTGSPITFTVTAIPGDAKNITYTSGNGQSELISTTLKNPFVVTVTDIGGNLVSGVSVIFSINSYPNGATGQTLSITNATTDINGQASTKLTLGNKPGIYTVTATSTGLSGSPITFTAVANYPQMININSITYNFPTRPNASDYLATDYRLIGLPGNGNKLITSYLSGNQNENWQIYWDNGLPGTVNDYLVLYDGGSNFYCVVGHAFWLVKKGPLQIKDSIPSAPLNADNQAEILLRNGWNLITNPFLNRMQWSTVRTLNSITDDPIYAYDRTFSTPTDFEPYIGYYFFNTNNKSKLNIPFNPTLSKSTVLGEIYLWMVNITLSIKEYVDRALWFGISEDAKDGFDHLDFRKPRLVGINVPYIHFYRPEWDKDYSSFASDIKSNVDNDKVWEFEVSAIKSEQSKLLFSRLSDIPSQYNILLKNESEGITFDLRLDSVYRFTPFTNLTKFKIYVIKGEDKKEKIISDNTPKEFILGENYPNPFNPSTMIPITVPCTSEITLSIYNLIGIKIKTIYSGMLSIGKHTFEWDGKDDYGNNLSSGIYIYRLVVSGSNPLNAGNVNLMGKMVLMK
jgi:hypothetical protein